MLLLLLLLLLLLQLLLLIPLVSCTGSSARRSRWLDGARRVAARGHVVQAPREQPGPVCGGHHHQGKEAQPGRADAAGVGQTKIK